MILLRTMRFIASASGGGHAEHGHHDKSHDPSYWNVGNPFFEVGEEGFVNVNLFKGSPFETNLVTFALALTSFIVILFVLRAAAQRAAAPTEAPKGMANMLEALVVFIRDDLVVPNLGKEMGKKFLPFFLTLFTFIAVANYLGMIPLSFTATSNIFVTFTLSATVLVMMVLGGFVVHGFGFLSHIVPMHINKEDGILNVLMIPIWCLLFILEFVGMVIKAFALMVRLFANMTAGHTIIVGFLTLPFILNSYGWGGFGVGMALFITLIEVLVCVLQAYVFTLLTAIFVGHSVNKEHH